MIDLILKLMVLRPLLSMAIFGVPVLTLILIGLFSFIALKVIVFVVIPIILIVWLVRRSRRPRPDIVS